VSCISAHDPQLARLADAIAQRVGQQRFHVWFNNSTRLDLKNDGLEIAVPNDFISEWIGTHFTRPIQELVTQVAWGEIWTRPGLDQRTRRVLVLGTLIALGRFEEFRMHARAALAEGGFSENDLKEIVLQQAIYCGVPAANTAFGVLEEIVKQ